MIKTNFLIVMTLMLTGCAGLLTSNQNINEFYTLNAIPDYSGNDENKNIAASIMVQSASVSKGLEGNKIMLMHSQQRLDYYANARWSSPLSAMVQTSVIESFENSHVLGRVGGDYSGMRADYALTLEIQDFQAEYQEENQPPIIHIKLVGKLVHFPERTLAASFTVETFQQADENELADIVRAFDKAFAGTQDLLIEETLDYLTKP